jgi:hypothetical protein
MGLFSEALLKAIDKTVEEAVLKALEKHGAPKPKVAPAGLKAGDAAKYIGISRTKFCNMIKVGHKDYDESLAAASFRVGRRRLWTTASIDVWAERKRQQKAAS